MWTDLIEGIYDLHNDPEDVAGYFDSQPHAKCREAAD